METSVIESKTEAVKSNPISEETFIVNCPNCKKELEMGEVEPLLCPFCGFDLEEYEDMVFGLMMEELKNDPENAGFVSEEEIFKVLRR